MSFNEKSDETAEIIRNISMKPFMFHKRQTDYKTLFIQLICTFKQSLRENTYRPTFLVPKISEPFTEFLYNDICT